MEKQFTYKPEVLVEMAQEYLQAEEAFRVFIKKHTPFPGYCNLTDRNDESEYWRLDKENLLHLGRSAERLPHGRRRHNRRCLYGKVHEPL